LLKSLLCIRVDRAGPLEPSHEPWRRDTGTSSLAAECGVLEWRHGRVCCAAMQARCRSRLASPLVLSLAAACASPPNGNGGATTTTPAAPPSANPTFSTLPTTQRLTLLHTSDNESDLLGNER